MTAGYAIKGNGRMKSLIRLVSFGTPDQMLSSWIQLFSGLVVTGGVPGGDSDLGFSEGVACLTGAPSSSEPRIDDSELVQHICCASSRL